MKRLLLKNGWRFGFCELQKGKCGCVCPRACACRPLSEHQCHLSVYMWAHRRRSHSRKFTQRVFFASRKRTYLAGCSCIDPTQTTTNAPKSGRRGVFYFTAFMTRYCRPLLFVGFAENDGHNPPLVRPPGGVQPCRYHCPVLFPLFTCRFAWA